MKEGELKISDGYSRALPLILRTEYVIPEELWPMPDDWFDEWAEVEDGYWINENGEMYSAHSQKYLKPKKLDKFGHVGYHVVIRGKHYYWYAHRLVASAFIPNPDNDPIVRHLDDDPTNNCIENLAWGTQKDNWRDSYNNGHTHFVTPEEREKGSEICRRPIYGIDLTLGEDRKPIKFRSIADAARELNLQPANIGKVLSNERDHTRGWAFWYADEED